MDNIRANILRRKDDAEREKLLQKQFKGELGGTLAGLRRRLSSDLSVHWVEDEVRQKMEEVESAINTEKLTLERVRSLTAGLDRLVDKARELEYSNMERLRIAEGIHRAFFDGGYRVTDYEVVIGGQRMSGNKGDLAFRHRADEAEMVLQIDTRIPWDQSIHIVMEGYSGKDSSEFQPDGSCGTRLLEIIRRAKELGVTIEAVSWKDPNDPGGLFKPIWTSNEIDREIAHSQEAASQNEMRK